MAKSRILGLALAMLLLAPWAVGVTGLDMSAQAAGDGKAEDKSAQEKIREMFGGEMIEHFPLQPFSVSIIRDNAVTDQVNIAIVIETKGEANRDKVILERYRIYDAYLRELYGLMSLKRTDGQLFDQQVIKIRLARLSDRLLGPGVINDILVSGISQRPLY